MPQNQGANWLFSRAFLFSVPVLLLQIYVTAFEREGLLLASGNVVGRDFVNYWVGGSNALKGLAESLFVFENYLVLLREAFGSGINNHNWSYPPHFLLLAAPFGAMPYLLGLFCWSVAGMLCYLTACLRKAWRLDDFLILALAPACMSALFAGQNGLFTAALLLGGLRLGAKRPVLAGICFGLLTIKPQLGLLLPFALLASRQWTVIASACITAAAAICLSGLVFGFETWWLYVTETWPFQTEIMKNGPGLYYMMATVFMSLRVFGMDPDMALLAHLPFTLMAVGVVIWAFSQKHNRALQQVILIGATFVATPYGFYYDMPVMAFAALLLARHLEETGRPVQVYLLPVTVWLLPSFGEPMSMFFLPLGPLFTLSFLGLAVHALYLANQPAKRNAVPAPIAQQA
ncbi:MAG: DUF2029 domain-containing protein [Alphaproteobacteria bacterium]|nr:DUF2029 domain-containing protein [Alphaproteobacteria bacterium]